MRELLQCNRWVFLVGAVLGAEAWYGDGNFKAGIFGGLCIGIYDILVPKR